MKGQVVAITGAGSGIGRSLSVQAALRGATLALSDINEQALGETGNLVGNAAPLLMRVDVRSDAEMVNFANTVEQQLGGADFLFNNAGVAMADTVLSMNRTDFEWVMDINFWGVVRGTEAFLPQLLQKKRAHIVNISSVYGLIAMPGHAAYNASKFAVRGYTETLRQELRGSQVRVTCVHPGGVRTNIILNGRIHRNSLGETTDKPTISKAFDWLARTDADSAARDILRGAIAGVPRVLAGTDAKMADVLQRLFPTMYPRIVVVVQRLVEQATGVRI